MISMGTKFPYWAWSSTWPFATLSVPIQECIPVCYDISLKSVQVQFVFALYKRAHNVRKKSMFMFRGLTAIKTKTSSFYELIDVFQVLRQWKMKFLQRCDLLSPFPHCPPPPFRPCLQHAP